MIFGHKVRDSLSISVALPVVRTRRGLGPSSLSASFEFSFGLDVKTTEVVSKSEHVTLGDGSEVEIDDKRLVIKSGNAKAEFPVGARRTRRRNFFFLTGFHSDLTLLLQEAVEVQNMKQELASLEKRQAKSNANAADSPEVRELDVRINTMRRYIQESELRLEHSAFVKPTAQMNTDELAKMSRALAGLEDASYTLQRLLIDQTFYIGPLREYPHRYYLASGEYPRDVGLRGENTAEFVFYGTKRKGSNLWRLRHWVKEMELGQGFRPLRIAEGMYTLAMRDTKKKNRVNISDIGFGASQVLPILVEGIYAGSGSLFLVEQPVIHLHPRLQGKLADFLIEISGQRKQIVAETHTEHLMLRLQRRIAEGKLKVDDLAIYYFDTSSEGTDVIRVQLNRDGTLKEWPPGFFEEDINDSYSMLAALGKSKSDGPSS